MLDAGTCRRLPQHHPSGLRHEIVGGILRAQPHLDRMSGKFNVLLLQAERFAAGDPQLQFDQIEPGNCLGNGVLDL